MSIRQGLRVGFCGAGGTGKTTTANYISTELSLTPMKSASRIVYEEQGLTEDIVLAMDQDTKLELQRSIFKKKIEQDMGYSYVADRTLLDHWCYCIGYCGGFMPDVLFEKMEEQVRIHMRAVYSNLFYFPWGYFEPNKDGVRQDRKSWQSQIDTIMVGYIVRWNLPAVEVPQTKEIDYRNEFVRDHILNVRKS